MHSFRSCSDVAPSRGRVGSCWVVVAKAFCSSNPKKILCGVIDQMDEENICAQLEMFRS